MKTLISSIFLTLQLVIFSQETSDTLKQKLASDTLVVTYTLTNGKVITQKEMDKIFQEAWDNSFGKMTEEEKRLLFSSSNIQVIIEK
jgi:hypothetical protein